MEILSVKCSLKFRARELDLLLDLSDIFASDINNIFGRNNNSLLLELNNFRAVLTDGIIKSRNITFNVIHNVLVLIEHIELGL